MNGATYARLRAALIELRFDLGLYVTLNAVDDLARGGVWVVPAVRFGIAHAQMRAP